MNFAMVVLNANKSQCLISKILFNQLHIDHGMIWVEFKSMVSDSTDIGTIFLEIIKCGALKSGLRIFHDFSENLQTQLYPKNHDAHKDHLV